MFRRYLNFIRALSIDGLSRFGVVLATFSAIIFLLFLFGHLTGIITSALVGLLAFMVLPALLGFGFLLIPSGWIRIRARTGKTLRILAEERFGQDDFREDFLGAPMIRLLVVTGGFFLLILGLAGITGLHFMDQPHFCGTACHKVMNPEWVVYRQSPHSRVACVQCHVGEGVKAHFDAKLNGLRQVWLASLNIYRRPIPTPVHTLRPARETCEKCHWPEKFYGHRLKTIVHYGEDKASTPRFTTLSLKINSDMTEGGIHWHVGKGVVVRYASLDDEREEMIWVEVTRPDGTTSRYINRRLDEEPRAEDVRTMDCVDCHNRATHIYETRTGAVEARMRIGTIDRKIPYIRKAALAAIAPDYPSAEAARRGIEHGIASFYRSHDPAVLAGHAAGIDQAVTALNEAWTRNVHPYMNLEWGSYPSLLGHRESTGCFRCHNRDMVDPSGQWITDDCTVCHSILAMDAPGAFKNLEKPGDKDPLRVQKEYLKEEFLHSFLK